MRSTTFDSCFLDLDLLSARFYCALFRSWIKSRGILHLVAPLVHPVPSFPRWRGHTVMLSRLAGILKIAARHNIRSTSFMGPVNEYDERWFSISFEQALSGTTWISFFLSLLSEPQIPLFIVLNEQQTSITIISKFLAHDNDFQAF